LPSPIIARADALMHRRRQTDNEIDDVPVLTDSIDQVEDFPVLTELEPIPEPEARHEPGAASVELVTEMAPTSPDDSSDTDTDPALREELILELASRIEDRIKAVLPGIISSTIREFLTEQETIANS